MKEETEQRLDKITLLLNDLRCYVNEVFTTLSDHVLFADDDVRAFNQMDEALKKEIVASFGEGRAILADVSEEEN